VAGEILDSQTPANLISKIARCFSGHRDAVSLKLLDVPRHAGKSGDGMSAIVLKVGSVDPERAKAEILKSLRNEIVRLERERMGLFEGLAELARKYGTDVESLEDVFSSSGINPQLEADWATYCALCEMLRDVDERIRILKEILEENEES